MATLTPTLSLSSSDLLSDALSFSTSTTFDASHTSGLARANLTSVSKATKLTVIDGDDAISDVTALEGQYIEITDNHGLAIKYVFADAGAGGVAADGVVIVAATDLGTVVASAIGPQIYGGRVVRIADGDTQAGILVKLIVVINSADGHNSSITAATISATTDGPQSTTMTNAVVGESGVFTIDAANATWIHVDNTGDAAATNSQSDHAKIVDKVQFTDPAVLYVKNTAAYHASNGRVFLYYDNHGAEDVMELRGQQFAYIPMVTTNSLYAYTSTSGTVVEFMTVGTEA